MTAVTRFITAIDRMRISGAKKAIMRYLLLRPEHRIKAKEVKKNELDDEYVFQDSGSNHTWGICTRREVKL